MKLKFELRSKNIPLWYLLNVGVGKTFKDEWMVFIGVWRYMLKVKKVKG